MLSVIAGLAWPSILETVEMSIEALNAFDTNEWWSL